VIVAIAVTISIIRINASRADFNKKVEQSQQEFEERAQEMLDQVKQ
jgi:hypothetical protein